MASLLSRREFLAQAAAVTAACCSSPLLAAPEPAAKITFGFSLYGMGTLPLDRAVKTCAEIGYDAVELAVMPEWPAAPGTLGKEARRRLRGQLEELHLDLPALMENTPLHGDAKTHRQQRDRLKAAAELGHELMPRRAPLLETILGGRAGQWEELRDTFAERLADWAKLAEQARTVIAIKPHRFQAMNLPEHAVWLLERVKSEWIRLAYDPSHFEGRGLLLADTLKTMLPATRFVHIKDVKIQDGKAEFLLPGDGTTDHVEVLTGLRKGGYVGSVCVEVSSVIHRRKDYDPIAAARHCYAKLAPAFVKAGLRSR